MADFLVGGSHIPAKIREEAVSSSNTGGFDFSNHHRNVRLKDAASSPGSAGTHPRLKKTGTTICGCLFKGGVVLGADTRATVGSEVAEKNCAKIDYIAPNIYCCGAGTAGDTENTTKMISGQLDLLRLSTGTQSRVITACTLFQRMLYRYQGHVSAALVLGGVDSTGPHLHNIFPHGSSSKQPYLSMGSGSLAAISVLESNFKVDMEEEEAVSLVNKAILAGIFNDLCSGNNVDITIIRANGEVVSHRGYETLNNVEEVRSTMKRPLTVKVPKGATEVLTSRFTPLSSLVTVSDAPAPMEL